MTWPDRQSTARMHPLCLNIRITTEPPRVEGFEDSPLQLFILGNGVHTVDGGEDQRQGRGLIFIQFINDLFERLQIVARLKHDILLSIAQFIRYRLPCQLE